ncbi:MAG: hypothetical protein FWD78_17575 [Treponema sp.]|nr:hypothetical protein [Treponema sp.]
MLTAGNFSIGFCNAYHIGTGLCNNNAGQWDTTSVTAGCTASSTAAERVRDKRSADSTGATAGSSAGLSILDRGRR